MTPEIEVKPVGKEFGLYVDGHLIGTTKLECDARFHMYKLREVMNKETA